MRSLKEFLAESYVNESDVSKAITFDFKGLENGEETVKSLEGREGVTISDTKVTVTVNTSTVNKLDTVQDILQQFAETIRNSSRRTNDEQYAQKTKTFADAVADLNDALDEVANPEEDAEEPGEGE